MKKDTLACLQHIRDAIDSITAYLKQEMPEEARYDAILYRLVVIGEAANQRSKELRARYPDVAWRKIIDCRNLLIHNYMGVDHIIIDKILAIFLPELRTQITTILNEWES